MAATVLSGRTVAETIRAEIAAEVCDCMRRTEQGLVGDADFERVSHVARCVTLVPGGVEPLTITRLLHNTLLAAELQTA